MEFLGSTVVYTGLVAAFLGFVSLFRPLIFLGMASRLGGVVVLVCGVSIVVIGFCLPARETQIVAPQMQLDRFAPVYQFHEVHSIRVKAPRAQVFRAIKEVRAGEILLFRTLTWIRRGGRSGGESILNAPENQPLLEVATRTSFLRLAEEPEREIVVGTIVQAPAGWHPKPHPTPEDFRAVRAPGFALAMVNFLVEEDGAGRSRVTTETRVYATDASARRQFAIYWRIIYPGSALIRRMWLRAIQRRAEGTASVGQNDLNGHTR